MSTRKLILTALVCGLAILIAGGVKLIQVADRETTVEVLSFGDSATLGDMTVSVLDISDTAEATFVTVSMVGVDLESGAEDGWRMLADGEVAEPLLVQDQPGACAATSAATPVECVVAFGPADTTRTVAYVRAGEQRQWSAS
jgi:hypothetical protein